VKILLLSLVFVFTLTLEIPGLSRVSETRLRVSDPRLATPKNGYFGKKIAVSPKPKPGHFRWSGGLKYIPNYLGKLLGRPPSQF